MNINLQLGFRIPRIVTVFGKLERCFSDPQIHSLVLGLRIPEPATSCRTTEPGSRILKPATRDGSGVVLLVGKNVPATLLILCLCVGHRLRGKGVDGGFCPQLPGDVQHLR
jgi:hypothetical protein